MLKIIPKKSLFLGLSLVTFIITACSKPSFREEFFKQRHCPEVRYQCLPESQEKKMLDLSQPYQLSDVEEARIKQDDTLRLHREVIKMLDIYYPDFWQDTDEKAQLAWMEKVDEITRRYYGRNRMRAELEIMASVCAIIGLNFEADPKLDFVVQKLKEGKYRLLGEINSYLRFEVLQKDYDEAGNQYNNWSLRGVRQGTPPMTRHVPDFNTEWKPYNPDENKLRIYVNTVRYGGKVE